MAGTPESEPIISEKSEIEEIETAPEVPPELQKVGVTPVPQNVTAQVADDAGQPLIQTPQTQTVTITIPDTPEKLEEMAKGSASDSSTWDGAFWLRIIKKAIHLGRKIIVGGGQK